MARPKGSGNRSELVQLALVGIDTQIQKLQSQIAELAEKRKQLVKGGAAPAGVKAVSAAAPVARKRVVSAATKRKLKEAAKARWARARAEKEGK